MASGEEPSQKRRATAFCINFRLCLFCQGDKLLKVKGTQQLESLRQPDSESYQNVLQCINRRARYQNIEYVRLMQQLGDISVNELHNQHAVWHKSCHSNATHKQHIERDKARYEKAISSQESSPLSYNRTGGRPPVSQNVCTRNQDISKTLTRSRYPPYKADNCFYCQSICNEKKERLINCQSVDVGISIQNIVYASGNDHWKVNLADIISDGDFLSRDIKYHKSCHTSNWRKFIQSKQRASNKEPSAMTESTVEFISAEIEFYAQLQDSLDLGSILTLNEVATEYNNMMRDHGILNHQITRPGLVDKIKQHISNFVITEAKGRKPTVIHSKETVRSAIDSSLAEHGVLDITRDMKAIFHCSKLIRKAIMQSRESNSWAFNGSLTDFEEKCVPVELVTMMRWIVQGAQAATTDTRAKDLHNTCRILSHSIVQSCKTKKQMSFTPKSTTSEYRCMFENPYSVGLSLYMYHSFRSQKAITLLHNAGVGITYDRVKNICNSIAISVCENIRQFGVYVPPGLLKNKTIRASIDNIDKKVDTPDGKHSFHGMAIGVYQTSGVGETIVNRLQLSGQPPVSEILRNVPETVIPLVPCIIEGSPKPKTSPEYPSYMIGIYDKLFNDSQSNDLAWMTARYCNRMLFSTNVNSPFDEAADISDSTTPKPKEVPEILDHYQNLETQQVHLWSAYNSLVHTTDDQDDVQTIDKTFSMPIINAAATEWPTLVTALDQLTKLNTVVSGTNHKLVVTLDMDLYKRVVKLEYLYPEFKNKWIFSPGAFHTAICALRCLGRTLEGSGLDSAWQEADLYSNVTVSQILNCNHYKRAMEAHQITLQTLFDLWFETFLEEHPLVRNAMAASVKNLTEACINKRAVAEAHQAFLTEIESLNLETQLQQFDCGCNTSPMHKWARMYMRQVMTLLQFQRSIREGNWLLYLASLEHLCKYFFSYSRLDYAQNIPEFLARMNAIKSSDPELWQSFNDGEFVVNTSNRIPFTRIGVDQAMEHLNKATKGLGGISGITTYPTTLLKFCLTAPELARLANEAEHLVSTTSTAAPPAHHQLSQSKINRQERAIAQLKTVLAPCNIFKATVVTENSGACMYNLMTKEIIPDDVQKSILATEDTGMEAYKSFVENRIIGSGNLWDKMTKVKQKTWLSAAKEIKVNIGSEIVTLKATTSLFARLLVIARSSRENVDLEEVIGEHEFAYTNQVLMAPDGSVHPSTDKSVVIKLLQDLVPSDDTQESIPPNEITEEGDTCLIVDGMGVVQELMSVRNFKTCKDLANAFVTSIDSKARDYSHVRVIFDNYTKKTSMKDQTRERRKGKTKETKSYIVEDSTVIKDKKVFLASNTTKDSLTIYLSKQIVKHSTVRAMAANRQEVITNHECEAMIGVSTHEEADTIMIHHAVEVAKHGMNIHIYSQDTDVLLLAIRRTPLLGNHPALIMGTSDRRRKVYLKPIYQKLGPRKSAALINWHALTGCDTTGHIKGKGKRGCFAAFMKASPVILQALSCLGESEMPSVEVQRGCEEFLCSLFCPTGIQIGHAKMLRWYMFKQLKDDQGVGKLPPTQGAWIEHIQRAHLQCHIWSQDMVLHPKFPDPLTLGWRLQDDKLKAVLSQISPAPASVLQLVRCNCLKSNCSKRCSCRRNNVVCTELCKCGGVDGICLNTAPATVEDESEDD